ncbi:unnamed protein product [Closterium sp. Naga37s-1]|nr:unnamed protein product [Closterium sp. Naga37s-1]
MELFHRDPQHWREIMLRERHHEDELSIVLGLDFGGTGIKGAPVDVATGTLLLERYRIPTPNPATPQAVADVIRQIKEHFRAHWFSCSSFKYDFNFPRSFFPHPSVCLASGMGQSELAFRLSSDVASSEVLPIVIDKSWININAVDLVQCATGCHVAAINDADAAGFAEMRFGAGRPLQREGTVLMTTFGTGIGTALFVGGHLVPNLEMGHIEVNGEIAEKVASGAVKEKTDMSWKKWAGRVNEYLARMEHYLQPDLIVIGGGISKKDEKGARLPNVAGHQITSVYLLSLTHPSTPSSTFLPHPISSFSLLPPLHLLSVPGATLIFLHLLSVPGGTPIVAAEMRNEAGIVGAAVGGSILLGEQRAAREAARLTPTLLS